MKLSTQQVAENALNTAPTNAQDYGWADLLTSAPSVMKNGAFAQPISNSIFDLLGTSVMTYMWSTAAGICWVSEQVFIATRTEPVQGTAPCDIELDKLSGARVCDSNGKAYFFIKYQSTEPQYWGSWEPVPGLDKLDQYSLDLTTILESAEWMAANFDGYLPQVDPQDAWTAMQSTNPPPGNIFINLPIMSADDAGSVVGLVDVPTEVRFSFRFLPT
ncbi:hypothetical protein N7474_005699 [Penicillium riverlandense]|uniref:uncharacterized protein n=1 Tax=Penicillium riverlandense TaxID=1903569 RepID=UPI0025470521|nr:uncharacterized protein N7474_005699 [Penicillium riverlandense]KAJ5820108.1 hypothetical protein N7474_005699 [Penicillium riverlandense]